MDIHERLRRIRHLALDLDGTVHLGGRAFPWTAPFLEVLRRLGIGRTFVTNNNSRSLEDHAAMLRAMGIDVRPEDLHTSTLSTIEHLREELPGVGSLFVLGAGSLRSEFREAGFREAGEDPADPPDAVVVGFDVSLTYGRLSRAAWWIARGKPFIATHPDRVCPTAEEIVLPDCGSLCACLAVAAGRGPDAVLGKPSPRMAAGVARRAGVRPEELAIAGDRLYTDMAMARASGALGILVLSGETRAEEAAACPGVADIVVRDLDELGRLLLETRAEC
jgi:HAD superfamily hydrolase (TIGR01450 family)